MNSIRLSRVGRKNAPQFRVVVTPKHKDPWGKSLDIVGQYNPRANPPEIKLDAERIKFWIAQGAEVTDTVWNLLVGAKIVEGKKRNVTSISKTRATKLAAEKKEAPAA